VEQNLQKLFKQASYQPDSRLSGDVWSLIESKNTQIAKLKTLGYMSLSVLSLSGSVLSIKSLIEQATKLGFFDYFSLAFSDSGVMATYWKEYTLSLADSLPMASLALSIFLLLILVISIRNASYQFKNRLLIV
jgi:hypothetical protein